MTDIRAADRSEFGEDDRLPWLEAVEEDEARDGPSALKMIVAVLIGLAAIGGLVGGFFWLNNRTAGGGGNGELIEAPDGAYKVRPDDPGGMAVEGEGDTAFAATQGEDPKGSIDTSAVPETPVTRPQPQAPQPATPAPAPKQEPLLKAPAPSNLGGQPAGGAGVIQLGAFSSQAAASNAWKGLSGRFRYLAPLSHSVVPVTSGGKTLYRLRASGPGAPDLCGRLRVAGENCVSLD